MKRRTSRSCMSLCILASALLLNGCGGGKNVLLNPPINRAVAGTPPRCPSPSTVVRYAANEARVYFDRDGDLYPGLVVGEQLDDSLFAARWQPLKGSFDAWKQKPGPWRNVADSLSVDPGGDGAWTAIQDSIRRRSAQWVNQLTLRADGSRRPLVILVHGFNVEDAECTYEVVKQRIETVIPDLAYLQVNWDGLVTDAVIPVIWSGAQFNFPLVGMGLRRLLKEVDPSVPVRVLTHSSGGPVIAHALWDASAAEGRTTNGEIWPAYVALHAMRADQTVPSPPRFTDLRLGMIVPATPASIFGNYDLGEHGPDRIVIGMNPRDIAVNKTFLAPCTYNGDTCLGARASYTCIVRRQFENNPHTRLLFFNFSNSAAPNNQKAWLFHEAHDWEIYMRRDAITPFLQALLTDTPVRDEGAEICAT